MSNGRLLNKLPIAIDYWKLPKSNEKYKTYLFFLTHLHTDHTRGLSSTWTETIYTSHINRDLLIKMLNVKPEIIKPLEIGQTYVIPLPPDISTNSLKQISVTLIDANHIKGSVMFLFEGSFGQFLYTGDFRWSEVMTKCPILSNLKNIERLYVDNTFEESHHEFPSRVKCLGDVLDLVVKHPYHRIIIGSQKIGKEDVLIEISKLRKEKVYVPEEVYEIFQLLGLEMSHFTTQQVESVLWYEPIHKVQQFNIRKLNFEMPTIIITLTASGLLTGKTFKGENVFNIMYSNHSSASELTKFLEFVQPVVVEKIVSLKKKPMISVIDQFMASKPAELTEDSSMSCDDDSTATEPLEEFESARSSINSQLKSSESVYQTANSNEEGDEVKTALEKANSLIDSLTKDLNAIEGDPFKSEDFIEKLQTLAKMYRPITELHPSMYYDYE